MWNDLNLTSPVHDICEYGNKDAAVIGKLPELVNILTSSAEILTEDHCIWEEIKIFKNLQYKYKRILKCDKCLQYLQRVGSCLRKMVLLDTSIMYLDLADRIIIEIQNKKDATCFLPSRQQLEYVLVRTQSAAKLICEALHYSREAFCYLIQRLKVGHLIINLMMATSVTARLNIVLKGMLVQMYDVYRKLYTWRQKLKKGGWEWAKPLDLPEDLEEWMNDSKNSESNQLPTEELNFLTTIFNKNFSSNADSQETSLLREEECMILDDEDNGVVVKRSEILEPEVILDIAEPEFEMTDSMSAAYNTESVESSSQKLLLKKIKGSKDIKELKIIWENLDFSTPDLLPQGLTPEKIRNIDKMFLKVKRKVSELKKSTMPEQEKKNEVDLIVKITRLKFAKTLGILQTKKKVEKRLEGEVKPVKTFKDLKKLYNTIYQKLQADQDYEKCAKLKKLFKTRKADMKLLVESGEKQEAKQLLFKTSKMFIQNYL